MTRKNTKPGRRQAGRAAQDRSPRSYGYDFGVPTRAVVGSASDFTAHLHDAGVLGAAYGFIGCPELKATLPCITLFGRNADAFEKAFAEFERWGAKEDGDVVEVAIVFTSANEYTVAIGPEFDRMLDRVSGFNRLHQPLGFASTWMLPVPIHQSSQVREFCKAVKGTVAPFVLSAATVPDVGALQLIGPSALSPVTSVRPILKFECTVFKAGDSHRSAVVAAAVEHARRRKSRHKGRSYQNTPPPRPTAADISARRTQILSRYFPVTLERFRAFGLTEATTDALKSEQLATWQIEQGICNIVHSQRLCKGQVHYPTATNERELKDLIIEGLGNQVEEVDGQHLALHAIGATELLLQIRADALALLRELGGKVKHQSLADLQRQLRTRGLTSSAKHQNRAQ